MLLRLSLRVAAVEICVTLIILICFISKSWATFAHIPSKIDWEIFCILLFWFFAILFFRQCRRVWLSCHLKWHLSLIELGTFDRERGLNVRGANLDSSQELMQIFDLHSSFAFLSDHRRLHFTFISKSIRVLLHMLLESIILVIICGRDCGAIRHSILLLFALAIWTVYVKINFRSSSGSRWFGRSNYLFDFLLISGFECLSFCVNVRFTLSQ